MVIVNGKDFGVDLIVLDLVDFDASREWIGWLLVMPLLTAIKKMVQFTMPSETPFEFRGDVSTPRPN